MILLVDKHSFQYEMEKICALFFPLEKIKTVFGAQADGDRVLTSLEKNELIIEAFLGEDHAQKRMLYEKEDTEMQMARMLVGVLSSLTGKTLKWGVLTGIRPTKLMRAQIESSGREKAIEYFEKNYLVSHKKAVLCADVAKKEQKVIDSAGSDSFCLYVSIPFCPTRCKYCSFVSHKIERTNKLIDSYVDALRRELELSGKIAKKSGLHLQAVYFGGGTPTTLSAQQLEKLLVCVKENFDLSGIVEYTVEAGRPDTVDREKLLVLKKYGVGRVSVNTQTFNDDILQKIGRHHTSGDFYKAYELAKECGFEAVNTDLIAGLEDESFESFCQSIEKTIDLSPENVTVHTLCLKRSSNLVTDSQKVRDDEKTVDEMVEYANERLSQAGYEPYYMYRQSKSLGNLENVGWCKSGRECAYNILMMEEVCTVIACGAGAVTKLYDADSGRIERIFNYKYPYEYIDRFDETEKRKNAVLNFFQK